jgi:hypothetical protein
MRLDQKYVAEIRAAAEANAAKYPRDSIESAFTAGAYWATRVTTERWLMAAVSAGADEESPDSPDESDQARI